MILFYFLLNYTISDVRVNARWTDPNLIIQTSGLKIGERFQESMLSQAIYNLNRLHLFNYIAIDTSIIGDGIFIDINVEEAPFLSGEAEFVGNKNIKTKKLKKKTELKTGMVLTNQAIFTAKTKVAELYGEKNYFNTEIIDSIIPDTLNRARLIFFIKEGTPLRISKIIINGNHSFSDSKIKRKMQNKEKGFLRSGKLDRNIKGGHRKDKGIL